MSAKSRRSPHEVLFHFLEDRDKAGFRHFVNITDFDPEYKYEDHAGKTILELAVDKAYGTPYVAELIAVGADPNVLSDEDEIGYYPIHKVADTHRIDLLKILLDRNRYKYRDLMVDVNARTESELNVLQILLSSLISLGLNESKGDVDVDDSFEATLECIELIARYDEFVHEFDEIAVIGFNEGTGFGIRKPANIRDRVWKRLTNLTPLQILCTFQAANAKPIDDDVHRKLADAVVAIIESRSANPNQCGRTYGTRTGKKRLQYLAGNAPPLISAAARGYHKVVKVLLENNADARFKNTLSQNVLHTMLKQGWNTKALAYGASCVDLYLKTLDLIGQQRKSLVIKIANAKDANGDTPLHFAKVFGDQTLSENLIKYGAKIDVNRQNALNVQPATLYKYFFDHSIRGDKADLKDLDPDDPSLKIVIDLDFFSEHEEITPASSLMYTPFERLWDCCKRIRKPRKKGVEWSPPGPKAMIKAERINLMTANSDMREILRHPVVTAFLEIELSRIKRVLSRELSLYIFFVFTFFFYLSLKYNISWFFCEIEASSVIYHSDSDGFLVTPGWIIVLILLIIFIAREFRQMIAQRWHYLKYTKNYLEWTLYCLVIVFLLPDTVVFKYDDYDEARAMSAQRYLASFAMIDGFLLLYLLLVRLEPRWPVAKYINMFTSVLYTYSVLFLCYLVFIVVFAYSFYVLFAPIQTEHRRPCLGKPLTDHKDLLTEKLTETTTIPHWIENLTLTNPDLAVFADTCCSADKDTNEDQKVFSGFVVLVKTLVMFVGEVNYDGLEFRHWVGYIIIALFVYLLMIVLMNILNGLAVSDIQRKIDEGQEDEDVFNNRCIIELLQEEKFVPLTTMKLRVWPNEKLVTPKFYGWFHQPEWLVKKTMYKAFGDDDEDGANEDASYLLSAKTVKALKELLLRKKAVKAAKTSSLASKTLTHEARSAEDAAVMSQSWSEINDVKRKIDDVANRMNKMESNLEELVAMMRQAMAEKETETN